MSDTDWFDGDGQDGPFPPVVWADLGTQRQRGTVVKRLSCSVGKFPALLVFERCKLTGTATSALVQLRMKHARLGGVSRVVQLDDVETVVGTFVRRIFILGPQRRRTVIAASVELEDGAGAIVQFVVPSMGQNDEELEGLSLLSVSKVLELCEAAYID